MEYAYVTQQSTRRQSATTMSIAQLDVENFLAEAQALIVAGRRVLVPRNIQALLDLEITETHAWEIISTLTPNNYCKGPEADHDGSGTFIWVFGAKRERKPIYIKLKIEQGRSGRFLKCLSFHLADDTMKFPLRPLF